jgi:hypothetical protein
VELTQAIGRQVKNEITDVIRWADSTSTRSLQAALGPSEIGEECDRRLAYRIAGIRPQGRGEGTRDPWAAIVGTSIHAWMEQAARRAQNTLGEQLYGIELPVEADPLVRGRSDLYHHGLRAVVDYKGAGPSVMQELKRGHEPSHRYKVQIHTYGLGHMRAGRPVDWVVLLFLPRAGLLKDAHTWVAPYNEQVALNAINRMYQIAGDLQGLALDEHPERWDLVPATPEGGKGGCFWCPMWSKDHGLTGRADDKGCPGL